MALNNVGSTHNNTILYLLFPIFNNHCLSAVSCFLVVGKELTLPLRVRYERSARFRFCAGTLYWSVTDCRRISRGIGEIPFSIPTISTSSLTVHNSEGNFQLSIKHRDAGSNRTNAAIHQMH